MDPEYTYDCRTTWINGSWRWNVHYRVTKYQGQDTYFHRIAQTGTSVSRNGYLWDGTVSIRSELFSALWRPVERNVNWKHLSSGTLWEGPCEEQE